MSDLAARHPGEQIVVVAHGGVLDALYRIATGQEVNSPRTWQLPNGAINRLLWTPEGFTLVGWSDTQHLRPCRRRRKHLFLSPASGWSASPSAAIDTPALVVDLDAMQRNLGRMAEFARKHDIRWRPHAKMHKSSAIAKLQMQAGAVGVCVQKTAEAEAMVAGGVHDVYISNEVVAPAKLARVAELAHRLAAEQRPAGHRGGQRRGRAAAGRRR